MTPTVELITQKFDHFNSLYFGGKLPRPDIKLSRARTFVGMMTYKRTHRDFCLRVSTMFDLEEEEMEDVVIHEMIHFYIAYFRLRDTSSHGQIFRKMMGEINSLHHRHVTISHRTRPGQQMPQRPPTRRKRTVAVVLFRDGRVGVKVLPNRMERIRYYYNNVKRNPKVADVRAFQTDAPYFAQFPCSSALRVAIVERETVERELHTTLD